VLAKLSSWFVMGASWTADDPLPGGDIGPGGVDGLVSEIVTRHSFIASAHARRLANAYGSRVWKIIAEAKSLDDLGPRIIGDLHRAELDYLRREEWARTADDVLWRRSKLGLAASPAEIAALNSALVQTPSTERVAG